jgi:plastocyanin
MKRPFPIALILLLAVSASLPAAEWGDLKVRFTYDGPAPKADRVNVNKDAQFCGTFGLVNEDLVVNPENGGIANVVVFLYNRDSTPPIHPDYDESATAEVVLDNKKCRFEPRVAVLRTTQTLILKNSDSVAHNTNYTCFANASDNVLIPAGGQIAKNLTEPEIRAVPVACNIHPWMKGWVVVRDTPYAAVSDKNGELIIKNLPVGEWTFQFYQEAVGYVDDVTLNDKATSWKRGRPDLEIKPGMNDLGEVKFKLDSK